MLFYFIIDICAHFLTVDHSWSCIVGIVKFMMHKSDSGQVFAVWLPSRDA